MHRALTRVRRPYSFASAVALIVLVTTALIGFTAIPANATDVTPTGLVQLKFQDGSFLVINKGLSTENFFDLGPGADIPVCQDGSQNNDLPPLGKIDAGGGTDSLYDSYPTNGSRDIAAGTATGGSTTTVVDATQTWTTDQWAGKSVWITSGPGSTGGNDAGHVPGAHIVSNTATTLTVSANSATSGVAGFTVAAGAGSVYHISTADPECTRPDDDSELAIGYQPHGHVVIAGTIAANGTISTPKTVRATEQDALTNGGIYFPPAYIPDAGQGVITAGIQPAPTATPATPFAGSINVDTGAVSLPINIRVQLQGGSGLTALGTNCFVPSSSSSAGIPVNLTTGTTSPPGPNQPITGTPYDKRNGTFTVVDNSFAVGGAGSACALLNLGASSINTSFGLPAAAGVNTASFILKANPVLNYQEAAPIANAGPHQDVHLDTTVTLDGSKSADPNGDAIDSYAWVQTGGTAVTLTGADTAHPTFTSPSSADSLTFQLTVTSTGTTGPQTDVSSVTVDAAYNIPPVTNAGANQPGKSVGKQVTLDGSASSDANNDALTYTWTQTGGAPVTLSDVHAVKPTFTTPSTGPDTLTFDLTVDDGFAGGAVTASTSVGVIANQVPVANAGANQTGKVAGNAITLDGSASSDADQHSLTYTWSQVSNGAPAITLSDTHAQKPTFTAPPATAPSGYVAQFSLSVDDGYGGTNSATTSVTVNASSPTVAAPTKARVGGGTTFVVGDKVTLSPGAITNPDGNNPADYSYVWVQSSGISTPLSSTTAQNPTYIIPTQNQTTGCTSGTSSSTANCPEYKVTITKINTNKSSTLSATLANYAAGLPARPTANAGVAQGAKVGATVTLDGSASAQSQSHPISYSWSQTGGPSVTLSDATAQKPTFSAPNTPAALTFQLVVTDTQSPITGSGTNGNTSLASSTTVTVSDYAPPVAGAGSDQAVHVADPVTLHGSASQPDNHALTYQWTQTAGPAVTLSDATALEPTFTAPNAGATLKFTLAVTDAENPNTVAATTTTPEVTVTVNDYAAPVANPGTDQTVFVGDGVTLDASGSSQADGHTLTYAWTQTAGPSVSLSDAAAQKPTFTAPADDATLKFTVTVTDTQNPNAALASATSGEVTIIVSNFDRPTADAGSDQSVSVGAPVTLHGSATQADNHTLAYQWTQTAGSTVTLSDATALEPTFTAPNAGTSLQFTLTVTDTENPNSDANSATAGPVTIAVNDYASPVVDAGADQGVHFGDTVTLAGSASQADNHSLTYEWTQTAGPAVTLSDATVLNPSFTAPNSASTLKFTLSATDTQNPNEAAASTTSGEVTITVTPTAPTGPTASVGDVSVVEGNASNRAMSFRVTLSQPATADVTVNYTVTADTATVAQKKGTGIDATAKLSGSLLFKKNTNTGITPVMKPITVQEWGNTAIDGNRSFHVNITSVTGGATAGRATGTGTIIDDDSGPSGLTVGVGDAAIITGSDRSRTVSIPVTLSDLPASNVSVTFTVEGVDATYAKSAKLAASSGADFGGKLTGTLLWKANGTRTKTVNIPIWPGSSTVDKTFKVTITDASGATIVRAVGIGTIIHAS